MQKLLTEIFNDSDTIPESIALWKLKSVLLLELI